MTVEDLLPRLEAVRRSSHGYVARCPAHEDRSPSLSVRDGERGVLMKCWAGCSFMEICTALGVPPKYLYFDSRIGPQRRLVIHKRRAQKQHEHEVVGVTIDACRQSDEFIGSRSGLDISAWSDDQLDQELNALAAAYSLLESEGRYE